MKDEEMAEQNAGNISGLDISTTLMVAKNKTDAYRLGRYDGFLAGFKAGRPQWHKVADGDLPPLDTNVLVIHRWAKTPEVGKRIKVFINSSVWVWAMCSDRFRYTSDDENVIAWCEIPTFDKEIE